MPPATAAVDFQVEHALASEPRAGVPVGTLGDADLVASALAGQRAAEERLYRRHAESVAAVAVRLLGRGAEAEDLVQDSFVTAFERLAQLRDPASFRAWVVRIAVRHAHRHFRRQKLLRLLGLERGDGDAVLSAQAALALDGEGRAELERLDRALHALPPSERIVWVLRHVEGYELTELAAACGVSLATVKRRLQRAEARVRDHVGGGR
jgi:RNA polymerase sigma-70 factor, ECF subfamily